MRFKAAALLSLLLTCVLCFPQAREKSGAAAPQPDDKKAQVKITPEQARQLFASVDEVFRFVSEDTNLPMKHTVEKKLASRDEVQKYIEQKMNDDEDTKRFERSEVVLKKFGLLPRNFQFKPFLIALLRDQVAGYYDVKKKTVYLLDWVDPELQKPVMAHELTHALQDQNFDLEKMENKAQRDQAEQRGDVNRTVELDEESTAQSAAIEGQGMITFADYSLRAYGHSAQDSPQAISAMIDGMGQDNSSDLMAKAPMLLRESLTFPYRDGMRFVEAVLVKEGKDAAFAGVLRRPPRNSFEVMTPSAYMDGKFVPPLRLPDIKELLGGEYEQYDVGAMGEFDVKLLLEQFAGHAEMADLTPRWNGGAYYAALRKGNAPDRTASIALLYASQWTDEAGANAFAQMYAASLSAKYNSLRSAECSPCEAGERRWSSEEGFIEIDQRGRKVVVSEGFEQPIALRLRDAFLSSGGGQEMSAGARELALRAGPTWLRAMLAATMGKQRSVYAERTASAKAAK